MKNLKIFISIIAGLLLVACADDAKLMISGTPGAPVLSVPSHKTTAWNKDSVAYVISLDSTGIAETFIGTSAKYGQNTTVTYSLQIDKTGNNFANPVTITSATKDTLDVSVSQLYTLLTNPAPSGFNSAVGVKGNYDIRIMANIGANLFTLYSNVISIKVNPLPSLKPYTLISPNLWYIIGLGDGNWSYSVAGIGVSMFPLSLVTGKVYTSTGDGIFTYTGYFQASKGFKIVSGKTADMGTWNVQWGSSDGKLTPVFKSSSSSNFSVPTDGYYLIMLNSITNTLSIAPTTAPAKSYSIMALSGDFNGWSATANPISAFGTTNNHQWYGTVTVAASGGIKFNNNNWANSWGDTTFPTGFGINNGPNIPITAGTYTAIFNDIDNCYYFIKH